MESGLFRAGTFEELEAIEAAVKSRDYSGVQHHRDDYPDALVSVDVESVSDFMRQVLIPASDMRWNMTAKGGAVRFVTRGKIFELLIERKKLTDKFSASDFLKQHNEKFPAQKKKLNNYLRLKSTKELIKRLYELKSPGANKRPGNNAESYFIESVSVGGNRKEIFLHKDLFLDFVMWINVDYKIAVYEFLEAVAGGVDMAVLEREKTKAEYQGRTDSFRILVNMHLEAGSRFGGGSASGMYAQLNSWADKVAIKGYAGGRVEHDSEVATGEEAGVRKAREIMEDIIWAGIKASKDYRTIRKDIMNYVHNGQIAT